MCVPVCVFGVCVGEGTRGILIVASPRRRCDPCRACLIRERMSAAQIGPNSEIRLILSLRIEKFNVVS